MDITLRPAAPADDEWCFQLHKAALGDVVAATWGWDDDVQRDHHAKSFRPGAWQIIVVDGQDAGVLIVERRPAEVCLARIEIHPGHQGRGVGTRLVEDLLAEARHRDQPLVLEVIEANHRAQALYERLGFVETGRRGVKVLMSAGRPAAPR
ncbi:GNAT family N-acetyltransferase [Lentzea tibetensis]|uniref:GNAT family N-acetyltransferase n=1 Tax=Lentzea tibetensis TaxID=2591470 RepID=A0A563EL05_9PSEU|nr:GNAT family N-acetyltransferase [Lentzea tibetensis]TWP47556.1 GNAT family N-acetyltransferase [Lentzea tibetensis]